jgi:hypothetical protein
VKYLTNLNYDAIEIKKKITFLVLKKFSMSFPFIEIGLQQMLPSLLSKPPRRNEMSFGVILNLWKSSSNST